MNELRLRAGEKHISFVVEDPLDHITRLMISHRRFYEQDLLIDVQNRLMFAPKGVAVDIGAHIGNHTLWFAVACDLNVVAFEPNPASRRQLQQNVERNDLNACIRVVDKAVGAGPSKGRVLPGTLRNSGTAQIEEDTNGDVDIIALDSMELTNVVVIKIDVEDHEMAVLVGARQTIVREQPLLYIEARDDAHRRAVESFLAPLGYWCFGVFARTPTYGFAPRRQPTSDVRLSIAVMAHPQRTQFVNDLVSKIDHPTTVVWDRRNDRWDTGARSLMAFDPGATHHLVIQDDAIVCKDLSAGLTNALSLWPHLPLSLYLGRQRPHANLFTSLVRRAQETGTSLIAMRALCWGVALCFPTVLIPEMVEWGNVNTQWANYDMRLGKYLETRMIPTLYTFPSLVNHRNQAESPSLIPGRTGANRVAYSFHRESALRIDWQSTPLTAPDRRTQLWMRQCKICGAAGHVCGDVASISPPGEAQDINV